MTKQLSSTNCDFAKGTLEHMKINVNFNLHKVKEIIDLLTKAASGVIDPVRRINSYFMRDIKEYKKKYENILNKLEEKQGIIEDCQKAGKGDMPKIQSFIEECQTNFVISNDHIKLVELMDKMITIVSLFNNLFNSQEFDKLVKVFNEVEKEDSRSGEKVNGRDNIINTLLMEDNTQSVGSESDSGGKSKKKSMLKKRKRDSEEDGIADLNKIESKKSGKNKIKNKSGKSSKTKVSAESKNGKSDDENNSESADENKNSKKKPSDEECTEKMKEAFPEFKGVTKTFLTRKLLKRITWSSEYDFLSDNLEKNHREIVKSATYKYIKLTIAMADNSQCNLHSDFINFLKELLKSFICQFKEDNVIVLAGELAIELEDFVEKIKNRDLSKRFSINSIKAQIFAFMEELLSDFDNKDEHTYFSFSPEEIRTMVNDFEVIEQMRKKWKHLKS